MLGDCSKVEHFTFSHPFTNRAKSAVGNENRLRFTGRWVDQRGLLQVWHLAALGLHVGVADVVARERTLSGDIANLSHKKVNYRLRKCT